MPRIIFLNSQLVDTYICDLHFIIEASLLLPLVFLFTFNSIKGCYLIIWFPFSFSTWSYHQTIFSVYHSSSLVHHILL